MRARGRRKRPVQLRLVWTDPDLFVKALHQLPARREPPRELREALMLFVGPRLGRIGARLTVVVAQILIPAEEPQAIAHDRPPEVRRDVAIPGTLVAAHPPARIVGQVYRLAGETGRLRVGRRVIEKTVAALPRDDVDDRSLNVAELRRRPDGLGLDLLDEIDARFGTG